MRELELAISELIDLESDDAAALPLLRACGNAPRIALAPSRAEGFSLAPGEYFIEVRARALEGQIAPRLRVALFGGGSLEASLDEAAPCVWRGAFTSHRSANALEVDLGAARVLFFAGARIMTAESEPALVPSLKGALVQGGRALFRGLPSNWRRALLASRRRSAWLADLRKGQSDVRAETARSGQFDTGREENAECTAWRADFDNRMAIARGLKHPAYVAAGHTTPLPMSDVKLIAYYLPQFHPIAENDAWWGKGFTEWSNVAKAAPQFLGHYQARLPGELGFYDLRTPGIIARQAALARAHGVGAFCFHYYWFAGRRLLEAPLDAFLADSNIDIEFCLCWANENWTRRWDGEEGEILIAQEHTLEDHKRVFEDMVRYMDDARYLRIDGKPVLVVYRPDIIDSARDMTAIWRDLAAQRGWPGLYLVATTAFGFSGAGALGFDALAEFPPHGLFGDRIDKKLCWLNQRHSGAVFDYAAVAEEEARRMKSARAGQDVPVFPGVMPGWDNEARRPGAGVVYHGATPEAYGEWLCAAVERARRTLPEDRRLVFINAWNEWAEGAYLEPDRAFGRAYLSETAKVMAAR